MMLLDEEVEHADKNENQFFSTLFGRKELIKNALLKCGETR